MIDSFFEYGRLKKIPTQIKKKEIVYEYIVSHLKMDYEYSEKELLGVLLDYYDDYATIKRDLIGMGFICAESRTYKRIK